MTRKKQTQHSMMRGDVEDQNEKIAAFFRVPNVYTSAWLMNSPTVIPMVTAIMAPPMSIPLSDAVSPPAWESPDYTTAS